MFEVAFFRVVVLDTCSAFLDPVDQLVCGDHLPDLRSVLTSSLAYLTHATDNAVSCSDVFEDSSEVPKTGKGYLRIRVACMTEGDLHFFTGVKLRRQDPGCRTIHGIEAYDRIVSGRDNLSTLHRSLLSLVFCSRKAAVCRADSRILSAAFFALSFTSRVISTPFTVFAARSSIHRSS